jgi:E3 ubiquitin-protein ligase RGLG
MEKKLSKTSFVYSQVISSLREAGLESSNLILGIDFTKSNEWTGDSSIPLRSI